MNTFAPDSIFARRYRTEDPDKYLNYRITNQADTDFINHVEDSRKPLFKSMLPLVVNSGLKETPLFDPTYGGLSPEQQQQWAKRIKDFSVYSQRLAAATPGTTANVAQPELMNPYFAENDVVAEDIEKTRLDNPAANDPLHEVIRGLIPSLEHIMPHVF